MAILQKRKNTFKRRFLATFAPIFTYLIIRILWLFLFKKIHISEAAKEQISRGAIIGAFWHSELLFMPFLLKAAKKACGRDTWAKPFMMISSHTDGEIISRCVRFFGIYSLRGSTGVEKGGARLLAEAVRTIKSGNSIFITPDGPRGPRHSVADGIIFCAQKTSTPIIFARALYSRFWEFKSWDRFRVPKPFSRIEIRVQEPIFLENLDLESARNLIKTKLEEDGETLSDFLQIQKNRIESNRADSMNSANSMQDSIESKSPNAAPKESE